MNLSLIIPAKVDTPSVILDKDNNQFELAGRSLPEDANEFYAPILDWAKYYIQRPNPITELDVKLDYYNSASARQILDLIIEFTQVIEHNAVLRINWYYETEDELMKEAGEELSNLAGQSFKFIEVESF